MTHLHEPDVLLFSLGFKIPFNVARKSEDGVHSLIHKLLNE